MLSSQAFQALSKADLYQIYVDLYKKNEEKDEVIKQYVITTSNFISKASTNSQLVTSGRTIQAKKVREFKCFPIKDEQKNLVIGSSLVKNLVWDHTIPQDIEIHAYRGSTTLEKMAVLKQYPEKKLKTVILQDGTNAIVKNCENDVEEVFNNYIELVQAVDEKFKPDQLVLMQIPPLKSNTRNHTANENFKVFNQKVSNYLNCPAFKENVRLMPLHEFMITLPDYNSLLYDDVHFSNHYGLPFRKNSMLSYLLKTSNSITVNSSNPMEVESIIIKTGNMEATIICVVKLMVRITMDEYSFSGVFCFKLYCPQNQTT